ncbi:ComEC/Rec2 family competence protein [Bdellovibrio svalbardensis]|uniref:ComEC/Rec2 family competence protein n=1 Tax=Bdellovibrio svalbardensis TaxID=2972972 RepID=A0ABT6DJT0_9BACT|nr:ComEC/Rec2 family competence protein [Bdellovibrio svalbardensis]MDG0816106.1 ComEC/Rec2 family competence protein [Bdellovibrio svalbardensis]
MIILLFLALTLSNSFSHSLLKNTSEVAAIFHQKCVQTLPTESVNRKILSSLLCGENITDTELKDKLIKTSLIHIFVISGSHLILLDELLSILRIPVFVRFLFLSFYSLAVGWQPPAVRALVALGARILFQRWSWKFPVDFAVLIAGCITLALFPEWWNSLSLVMSWCAALALCWVSVLKVRNKFSALLLSQLAIFLFMSAPLWGLGALHPLSLLYNLLLAPVVAFVLLPLAFFAVLIHPLLTVFDFVMKGFEAILKFAAEPITITAGTSPSIGLLWGWVFAWHIFFHLLRLRLYQGRDLSR